MILRKKWLRSDRLWVNRLTYRDPIRRFPIFFDTMMLMKSQYWPRAQIDSLAEARLQDIMERVSTVPLWRERFTAVGIDEKNFSRADLAKLPILTKHDFFSNDVSYYTHSKLIDMSHVDFTSGSTGKPFQFHLDWRAELRYFAIRDRMFQSVAGGEKLPVVYFRGRVNPGFFFGRHVLFFLRGYNSIKHRLQDFIELVLSLKSEIVLYGYTSSMRELARRVHETGISLPIRAIVATGESVREADRTYIEEHLHTKFILTYATWEVKWVGHECEYHNMHINEEYVFVEIVDENGTPLPSGVEGRILITSFDSEAMPFIRYAVGDRGVISEEPCPCKRTLRTIKMFGRQTDIIQLPDNRIVPLFDVSTAFDTFALAVQQYQILQTGENSFRIKVIAGPKYEEQRERLHARMVGILHPDVSIEWETVDDISEAPSGKAAYFIRAF